MPHEGRDVSDTKVPREDLVKIITDDSAARLMIKTAEKLGRALSGTLATSQIRAIFDEVRTTEGLWTKDPARAQRRLNLLKPKMQYRAGKEKRGVTDLVAVLDPAVDIVLEPGIGEAEVAQRFRKFVEFFEAILAYHRAAGGR